MPWNCSCLGLITSQPGEYASFRELTLGAKSQPGRTLQSFDTLLRRACIRDSPYPLPFTHLYRQPDRQRWEMRTCRVLLIPCYLYTHQSAAKSMCALTGIFCDVFPIDSPPIELLSLATVLAAILCCSSKCMLSAWLIQVMFAPSLFIVSIL